MPNSRHAVNVGIIIDVIVIVGVKFILWVVRICRNSYSNKKMICNEHSNASLILRLTYLQ